RESRAERCWYGACSHRARMRMLLAILLVAPLVAGGQEQQDPQDQPEPQQIDQRPYRERCSAIMRMAPYQPVYINIPARSLLYSGGTTVPAPAAKPPLGGTGGFSGGGGGSGSGYAMLVIAVVVIAALPFVVYALDGEADGLTRERFECPEFNFSMMGGAQF